jgi:Zn finger protein HypA/HybF involved in hydrogenase expression
VFITSLIFLSKLKIIEGKSMVKCPKCQYEHRPAYDAIADLKNHKPEKPWIGEFGGFENYVFKSDSNDEIWAKLCPKCKAIFVDVSTSKKDQYLELKAT